MRLLDPLAHAQARRRLLDAARTVFAARGYHAASMNDVARAAGVAKAGVYHYFAGKHALLEALHEDLWAEGLGRLKAAPQPRDLAEAYAYLGAQYLSYFSQPHRAELMRIAFNISVVEPQLLELSSGTLVPRMQEELVAYLAPCFPRGAQPKAILLHVIPFIGALFYYLFILRANCPASRLPATQDDYLAHLVTVHAGAVPRTVRVRAAARARRPAALRRTRGKP